MKVVCTDLCRFRLPAPPYRAASNVPFTVSTDLLHTDCCPPSEPARQKPYLRDRA